MHAALYSILPVLIVIATGWAIHRFGIIDDAGRAGIERLAYYVLFPCLIVLTLAGADYGALPWQALGATLLLSVLTMTALCLALYPVLKNRFRVDGPAFTSVFQGAARWNTFIALALSGSLFGKEGLTLVAVAIVAMVPILNLISVVVLAHHGGTTRPPARILLREIAKNPLIIACVVGLTLSIAGLSIPGPIAATLDIFGRAGLAVALVAVGLGLDLSSLRRPGPAHLVGTGLRLIVMPAIGLVYASLFGLTGTALGTAVVALAVPTASNGYLLARQMGGNAKLMAEIITLQTMAAAITLPLWLALMALS
ncbi:AEC family transporter [Microbaculum sp. FT89]|uniref:AEC family transporter n=1 Tax=Microbaculum sp. FT89 TaxID=3447298 RepID=UPI003F532DBE